MRHSRLFTAVAGVLFLVACGGGGSSTTVSMPPPVANKNIVSLGPLDDSASFSVNGEAFATIGADVRINGQPGLASDLRTGHMVRVRGESAGGTATAREIVYEANVLGPVAALDLENNFIVVMGQRIHVSPDTILDAALDAASQLVEVSGHRDEAGDILATRIDVIADAGVHRLWGVAGSVDSANFLFRVGGLIVDYGSASLIDVPGGEVTAGMEILISGRLDPSGVLLADELGHVERDLAGVAGFDGSLTGIVTHHESTSEVEVAGFVVRIDRQTGYVGGAASDLRTGNTVRIDGRVNAGGWLEAVRIYLSATATLPGQVTYPIDGFVGVKVDGPFLTTIEHGDEFRVEVTVDEDVTSLLDVRLEGSRLRVGFRDNVNVNSRVLRARVVMPALDDLRLAGATYATVRGFDGPRLDLDAAGAVFVVVKDSHYDRLSANLAGACALQMQDSAIADAADVDVVGASAVTLNLLSGANLDGVLLAASALHYYGDAVAVDVARDLTSAVIHLGASR